MGLAAVLLMRFGPAGLSERFHSIRFEGKATNGAEGSTRIHVELAKAGIRMIRAHPFFGVGLDQFKPEAPRYNPKILEISDRSWLAHDTFIQIGAECGLPILLLFLSILIAATRNFGRGRRSGDPALADLGFAMQAGLIGISLAAISITIDLLPFWLLIFMSPSFSEICEAEASSREAANARQDQSVSPPRLAADSSPSIAALQAGGGAW
jgi:O-antigen ligase